jgi:hypothetical protein
MTTDHDPTHVYPFVAGERIEEPTAVFVLAAHHARRGFSSTSCTILSTTLPSGSRHRVVATTRSSSVAPTPRANV